MSNEAFNARWGRGIEETDQSKFIMTMFRYANRRTDPDVVNLYLQKLGNIPMKELAIVWDSLNTGEYFKAQLPSAELVYKTWLERSKRREEIREDIKAKRSTVTPGERETAWKATQSLYANRCNNRGGIEISIPEPEYYGDFDYKSVAHACPLPSLDNHKHEWHWAKLKEIFTEEWDESHIE